MTHAMQSVSCVLHPQWLSRAPKQAAKEAPSASASASPAPTPLPPGLRSDPFLEPLSIRHLLGIRDLCLELGLASIEAQQRGHAGKKVRHAQVAAQYVWRVELDLAEGDAALFLADARRYEIIEDG